jgi:hypothetical protein
MAEKRFILYWEEKKVGNKSVVHNFSFCNHNDCSTEPSIQEQSLLIEEIASNPFVDSALFCGAQVSNTLSVKLKDSRRAEEHALDVALHAVRSVRKVCNADLVVTTVKCAYLTRESLKEGR